MKKMLFRVLQSGKKEDLRILFYYSLLEARLYNESFYEGMKFCRGVTTLPRKNSQVKNFQ